MVTEHRASTSPDRRTSIPWRAACRWGIRYWRQWPPRRPTAVRRLTCSGGQSLSRPPKYACMMPSAQRNEPKAGW